MSLPTLQPLSTGEILDRTFSLYRSHFLLFLGVVTIPQLLVLAATLLGLVAPLSFAGETAWAALFVWYIFMLVVVLGASALSQGATVVAVSHVYLGRSVSIRQALSEIRGRIVSLAITVTVLGTFTVLGFLACIVPGLIMALAWSLAAPVAVLEHRSLLDAASRSSELTSGRRFRVFVIYGLFTVVGIVASLAVDVPIRVVAMVTSDVAPGTLPLGLQLLSTLASWAVGCLVGPLGTIGLSVIYYDERVRRDGFDLELMMAAVDAAPSSAAGA